MITSFEEILRNAEMILKKLVRSQATIDGYLGTIRQIFKTAIFQNQHVCSEEFLKSYLAARVAYFQSTGVGKGQIQRLHRTISLIHHSMSTDPLTCQNPFDFELYDCKAFGRITGLPNEEQALIQEFEAYLKSKGLSESCIKSYKSRVIQFITLLHKNGCENLRTVTDQNAIATLSDFCLKNRRSYSKCIYGPKAFFKWLFEGKGFPQDLSPIFRVKAPRYYPEVKVFAEEEIVKLLQSLDKSSYDEALLYTFLTLIRETGLRKSDAIKLEVKHINWQDRTITICQSKTKKDLQLPLTDRLASVLSWFLLRIRPTLARQYIFVCNQRPYKVKTSDEIGRQFGKLKNEILGPQFNGYGFNSLRRSLGTKLYESDIPNYLIAEILGHSSINSTKPYIRADRKHLQECCLPLSLLGGQP